MSYSIDETTKKILEIRGFFRIRNELDIRKELYHLDRLTKKHHLESQHHQILPPTYWVSPRYVWRTPRSCYDDAAVFLAFVRSRHLEDIQAESADRHKAYMGETLAADFRMENWDGHPTRVYHETETNHIVGFGANSRHDPPIFLLRVTQVFDYIPCLREKKHFFSKPKVGKKRISNTFVIRDVHFQTENGPGTNLMIVCGPFSGAYAEDSERFATRFEFADVWFKNWNLMLRRLVWAKIITEAEYGLLTV